MRIGDGRQDKRDHASQQQQQRHIGQCFTAQAMASDLIRESTRAGDSPNRQQ